MKCPDCQFVLSVCIVMLVSMSGLLLAIVSRYEKNKVSEIIGLAVCSILPVAYLFYLLSK